MTEHQTNYQAEQTTEPLEIAEYQTTTAALGLLREQYAAPFDVTTPQGMTAARAARAEVRGYRAALEKTRAEIKAPALERCRVIDAEAKRINAELLAIEEPIDAAIKAEEMRKTEEKAARERAEAARVAALQTRIDAIRQRALDVASRDAATLRAALADARAFAPDPDAFAERWPDAMQAIAEVRQALETLLAEREEREARQAEAAARLQAEREELARQQAELDRQRAAEEAQHQAERDELARWRAEEAARQAIAAQASAERERQEAEAKARAEEEARAAQAAELEALALAENPANHKARRIVKDSLAAIKKALAAGTLTGPEAIDRAYQVGFEAGESAARKAA